MYYNQGHYDTPYPHPAKPNATIKTSGCGPTSMAMVLEDLTGQRHTPEEMAAYALKNKARVSTGTDMHTLCKAVARDFGLTFSTTSQAADALAAMGRGAGVIANVGGAKSAAGGLFSSEGHYIYLRAAEGTQVTVWDAGYYPNKYNTTARKGKVLVDYPNLYAQMVDIDRDCSNRNPRYYILEDIMTYEQFKAHMDRYEAEVRERPVSHWAANDWETATELKLFDGTMPQAPLTREQAAVVMGRVLGKEAE